MTEPARQLNTDPLTVWQIISENLEARLPRQSFLTWFKPIQPISFNDCELTLGVPSRFYFEWIESHYQSLLDISAFEAIGDKIKIVYQVDPNLKKTSLLRQKANNSKGNGSVSQTISKSSNKPTHLNESYRFSNFIEGDCNRFARAAAISLSESPGKTPFNPMMIYGKSGLGKTHLIQAIGNYIINYNPSQRVLYVTSEQFTTDFVNAIKSSRTDAFSRLYRSVDVLLLDDVQFFMSKDRTQEEFFHTFNSLHQKGKQLVFSSDRPPRDLVGFDERIVGRLQWGLVTELQKPDFETRMAILKGRAEENSIVLPDDVTQFLAANITDNVRTLQGALIHMIAQASLLGEPITVELARNVLKNFVNRPLKSISINQVQEIISEEMGIPTDLLRSKTRKKDIVEARQIAMYLSTELTTYTLKAIGLQFGGRDHSTVIHARESVNEKMKANKEFQKMVERIRQKVELAAL